MTRWTRTGQQVGQVGLGPPVAGRAPVEWRPTPEMVGDRFAR